MEKEESKKLVNKLIRQAKSLYPNDAVIKQRAALGVLTYEYAILVHHLEQIIKQGSFPPGRSTKRQSLEELKKELKDVASLQKELEKVMSIFILVQGEKLNLPLSSVEELKQELKEMGILAEIEYLEEKDQEQMWLQERDKLTEEQLVELNKAIDKQIMRFREELACFFQRIYQTEQERINAQKEYLDYLKTRMASLDTKIGNLEKELQGVENIIKDKKDLVIVDNDITDIENQIVDDHTNLAMRTLQEGGVKETTALRADVRKKTANVIHSNREGIISGVITSKQIVSTVVKEAPISAKENVAVLAVIENPSESLQKQFDETKAKSGTLLKDLQKLFGEKKDLETQLKEHLKAHPEIKGDATLTMLTERVNGLVKQIDKYKAERAKLEEQAKEIKQMIDVTDVTVNKNNPGGDKPDGPKPP